MVKEHNSQGDHIVIITVNNKPVKIEGPKVSGLQVKQAAIDAGLPIELDFELKELKADGAERQIIGNDDVVTVNKNSEFIAAAADDNS